MHPIPTGCDYPQDRTGHLFNHNDAVIFIFTKCYHFANGEAHVKTVKSNEKCNWIRNMKSLLFFLKLLFQSAIKASQV